MEAQGRSGGMLSMWDEFLFNKLVSIKNRNFLAVAGNWIGIPGETIFVNVYAP